MAASESCKTRLRIRYNAYKIDGISIQKQDRTNDFYLERIKKPGHVVLAGAPCDGDPGHIVSIDIELQEELGQEVVLPRLVIPFMEEPVNRLRWVEEEVVARLRSRPQARGTSPRLGGLRLRDVPRGRSSSRGRLMGSGVAGALRGS